MSSELGEKDERDQVKQAERGKDLLREAWDRPEKDLIQKVEAPNQWPDPPEKKSESK